MKTQLLIKFKPNNAILEEVLSDISMDSSAINDPLGFPLSEDQDFAYRPLNNKNITLDVNSINIRKYDKRLINIDLYESTEIPLNFTILDIKEPEKRKTNFSKTIIIPGTKNNNRIFNHIYEISGNSKFNPNIRTEVIILQNGVQVMRGNMQLKNMFNYNNKNIEYEIVITGDLTSLFAEIGNSKLSDLDFSEYDHIWSRDAIVSSWYGSIKKNGRNYSNLDSGSPKTISSITRQSSTGRALITTSTSHSLSEGDWVRLYPLGTGADYISGEWQAAEIITGTTFTINHPFPDGIFGQSITGTLYKYTPKGEGYVYPMVSWGDDSLPSTTNSPEFPVSSFVMAFFVKEIWDKIFEETNSEYESDFLESDLFKRLIIAQKRASYTFDSGELASRKFKVANTTQHSLRIAGFDTNQTGSYAFSTRSYPTNELSPKAYVFGADVDASDGLLYNGIEGSRPFNTSTNKWRVSDSARYSFDFSIMLNAKTYISSYTTDGTYDVPTEPTDSNGIKYYFGGNPRMYPDEDCIVTVKLMKRSNGLTTVLDSESVHMMSVDGTYSEPTKNTYRDWTWPNRQVSFSRQNEFLNKDDELWIEVSYISYLDLVNKGMFTQYNFGATNPDMKGNAADIKTYRGTWDIDVVGAQYFYNEPNEFITEGSLISSNQFLPLDMTCSDFLLSVIRMFNLYIESDKEVENKYIIEPRDDYYYTGSGGTDDYADWTDKVDIQSMEITPMGELTAKYYNFQYKKDTDYWNKKYLEEVGVGYGNYTKEMENDFLTNSSTVTTSFGSTVMINSPEDSTIIIPQVVQKDTNNVNTPIVTAPKILIWGGPRPTSKDGIPKQWKIVRTTDTSSYDPTTDIFEQYPYAGTVDSPFDPLVDLNWFYTDFVYWNRARWSNVNLYNKYWSGFISEISDPDSKLIKCYARLKPNDINILDFKKIFVINNNYLRLQKIVDYNANGDGLTKCEFLKLKSPSKFKTTSIFIDEDFTDGVYNINDNVAIKERPPQNYINRYPVSNFSKSSLSGTYNPNINGQNNNIGKRSNNVSIQGDENYIGNNSNNIILNGNGIFVSGGLKNISVFGTNNLVINESDVTYINGIRYKNGVAISRANVINGGVDVVSTESSINTVANVINGSEDLVVDYGSNSIEDVINSGTNCILPDLPIYGVSTQIGPNPNTNDVGSLIRDVSTTKSLPDEIIQKINPRPYKA